MAQRRRAMELCAYGSCIQYWSGILINTSWLIFRLAWSNPCIRKKNSLIKQILWVIFSRNGMPKTLVSNNAPEFCDEDFNLWLKKRGWKPYKTPAYHPQSNGLVERMVQTVKMGQKACFQQKEKIEVFLTRLLLSYHTIPHAGRLESPSALMGRQIRAPLTMSYSPNEKVWYKKNKESNPEVENLSCKKAIIQL